MVTLIDISKKCNKTCKCYVNQVSDITAKREDNVTQLDSYGYCTHISGSKKLVLYCKTIKLETTSGISFTKLQSVTTYYHKQYEPGSAISRPLIIRVQTDAGKTLWYENAGHYANKKWRKIGNTNGYPEEDNYDPSYGLKKRLTDIGCRLYGYHQIDIQYIGKYSYTCLICGDNTAGEIKPETSPGSITGYTKYTHEKITDKSILVYNGGKITYKRKDNGKIYYLPIPINDPSNIKNISVYYWEHDKGRENPLLVELETYSGYSFWFENISKPGGKNDKWRQMSQSESNIFSGYGSELQNKLDILSCIFNGTVVINLGTSKDCHNSQDSRHRNRIRHFYNGSIRNLFGFAAHEYTSRDYFGDKTFNISDLYFGGKKQNFPKGTFPLKNITKLDAYVSSCDSTKPFLIHVESEDPNSSGKWYYRNSADNWMEHQQIGGKGQDEVKDQIAEIFRKVQTTLYINGCSTHSHTNGVQLNIRLQPDLGHYARVYGSGNTSILLTKYAKKPVTNFFRITHQITTRKTFNLKRELKGGDNIGTGTQRDVKEVDVYFWDGQSSEPVLVGLIKSNGETFYYGKFANIWMNGPIDTLNEQEALDHLNCQLNSAIPIDLNTPKNLQPFHRGEKKSTCLPNKSVSQSQSGHVPYGAKKDYQVEGYQIPHDTRISRVTYNYQATNIVPPYTEYGLILNIYSWSKKPEVPLLVEFKPKDGKPSTWYENICEKEPYTNWRNVEEKEVRGFYMSQDPKNDLTEKFTDKLNEVNCRVNKVVKLDISRIFWRYCNSKCKDKRIKVTQSREKIHGYVIYEHTSIIPNENTFTISSVLSWNTEQKTTLGYPLRNVAKVTVYFADCNPYAPILVKIEDGGNSWLKRKRENDGWEDATVEISSTDRISIIRTLEELKQTLNVCNSLAIKPPPFMSENNSGVTQVSNLDNDQSNQDIKNIFTAIVDDDLEEVEEIHELEDEAPNIPKLSALIDQKSGIIIDIRKRPRNEDSEVYILDDGHAVKLEKSEDPQHSGFWKFTHSSPTGQPFTIKEVIYGESGKSVDVGVGYNINIKQLSVWYWTSDYQMENPLFIEIEKSDNTYKYHASKGRDEWYPYGQSKLKGESLEQTLDGLNCLLNKAVTMDISYSKSGSYCCNNHKKISATPLSLQVNGASIVYHKQTISDLGDRLAKIKYYQDNYYQGLRKRIKFENIPSFHVDSPVNIYTFYCGSDPKLIYIEKVGGSSITGWYKKGPSDHNWTDVSSELSGIIPSGFLSLSCQNFNKIVNAINCFGMPRCSDAPSSRGSTRSLLYVTSASIDLEVTIELEQKPTDDQNPTYYQRDKTSTENKNIKVTRTLCPFSGLPQDFYKYEHKNQDDEPFKLKEVLSENGKIGIIKGSQGQNILSVSAYYWRNENGSTSPPTKALLVEVVTKDTPGNNYAYYTYNKDGRWSEYTTANSKYGVDQTQLIPKLITLNCEINGVVQIDVAETSSYCHVGYTKDPKHSDRYTNKISVEEVDKGCLGNYRAYEHTPSSGAFKISSFRKGNDYIKLEGLKPDLPLKNTSRIVVYFCMSDLGDPLLIYLPDMTQGNKWFQKPTNFRDIWEPIANRLGDDSNHSSIVKFLDTINSLCKPPEVTIDIYSRGTITKETSYPDTMYPYLNIVVKSVHSQSIEGFTEYYHTIQGRTKGYFTIKDFNYDGNPTQGSLGKTERVTSVSVYYWSPLETRQKDSPDKRGRPLLVKVIRNSDGVLETNYYENTRNSDNQSWQYTYISSENLQKKLHLLNCKFNNAVVMDIGKHEDNETYDACKNDNMDPQHGESKMKVVKDDAPVDNALGSYEVYSHTLNKDSSGDKFHIVGFRNGNYDVILPGVGQTTPNNPILDVDKVKVYFCSKDDLKRLLLIYIKTSDPKFGSKKWWKSDDGKTWEKVISLAASTEKDYDRILKVLNTLESKCNDTPEATAAKSVAGGLAAGSALWSTFGGSTSGTLAGAGGLTGFGWWMFKRSKGDPWVGQI
ncbi:hypothetical protein BEWA_023550 [Theileria equi strain WA]|uniref:Uncharacterized protein n=1 Tax=Theileria equi strain WA TaxID=1537102 RepID=L0AWW2_THEEQ|nr:hypothetical protein BEWA_023550 [Theileria equi strain WA]AFZ79506.1 hypothetical protein BEWA_023550 [Theileria equi strain WA]|eukprot:XP_004829172.1 hypothetical protein BEWA_023550 [Theileria equi strain WA]